ncbi:hypothetical protein AB6E06_22165 [Vibrio splendidus]
MDANELIIKPSKLQIKTEENIKRRAMIAENERRKKESLKFQRMLQNFLIVAPPTFFLLGFLYL